MIIIIIIMAIMIIIIMIIKIMIIIIILMIIIMAICSQSMEFIKQLDDTLQILTSSCRIQRSAEFVRDVPHI